MTLLVMKSMEDSDNCNYKVFIQFAWKSFFIFPQTISHQFLIVDKSYPRITGNISQLNAKDNGKDTVYF